MAFVSHHENPLRTLAELKLKMREANQPDSQDVLAELRVHPAEFDDAIGVFSVSIREATLSLDFEGVEPLVGTRVGTPNASPVQVVETQIKTTVGSTGEFEGGYSATASGSGSAKDGPQGKLEVGHKNNSKSGHSSQKEETTTRKSEEHRLRFVGNDNWRVTHELGVLDHTFLEEERVCTVTAQPKGNRRRVEAELSVKLRHMDLKLLQHKKFFNPSPDKARAAIEQVLLGRSLARATGGSDYQGFVVLARSEVSDEE